MRIKHARSTIPLDSGRDGRTFGDIPRKPDVILCRWRDLLFVLVEISAALSFAWRASRSLNRSNRR